MSVVENKEFVSAVKWSTIAEVLAKLISPITSMVLARLLTPDAFGLVASITIVISFCDLFTDIGCNKYIIQHQFPSDSNLYKVATVAFWSNLCISSVLWFLILFFDSYIAYFLNIQGYEFAIVIAAFSLFMTSFSSVQVSLMRKKMDFKDIFKIRILVILFTLVISISLAYLGFGFWAIILGNLFRDVLYAVLFTYISKWKPDFHFDFFEFKDMMAFGFSSFLENLFTWFKSNISVLILSSSLSSYFLGLYKTPITIDNSILGLLYSSLIPVLYSALSRVSSQIDEFQNVLFRLQRLMAMVAFPIGMILLVFNDVVTKFFLGGQWMSIAWFVGLYGCSVVVENVFCIFCIEAYRAAGKPKFSAITVGINAFIIGISVYAVRKMSFDIVCYVTVANSFVYLFIQKIFLKKVLNIPAFDMLKNIGPFALVSILLGAVSYAFSSVCVCMISRVLLIIIVSSIYMVILFRFKTVKEDLLQYIKK